MDIRRVSEKVYYEHHVRKLTEEQKTVRQYFQQRFEELDLQLEGIRAEHQLFINRCARELNVPLNWKFVGKDDQFVNPEVEIDNGENSTELEAEKEKEMNEDEAST